MQAKRIAESVGALVVGCHPFAHVGEADACSIICAPSSGRRLICSYSISLSGPGLCRMLLGTPALPMSCRIPAKRIRLTRCSLGGDPTHGYHLHL